MTLTKEEILHIANLARLNVEPAEVDTFRTQLNAILDHVAKLQEVDTSLLATGSAAAEPNIDQMRVDAIGESLPNALLLRSATSTEKQQYQIPPVFE